MNKIKTLRKNLIKKAKIKRIKDIKRFTGFVNSINDIKILQELENKLNGMSGRWYEFIKLEWDKAVPIPISQKWALPQTSPKIEVCKKSPSEIGEPLEDLVEIALRDLGCEVNPAGATIIRDTHGLPWVYNPITKRYVLYLKVRCGLPKLKLPKFNKYFARYGRVANMPDFVSESIAIEVKNRDPTYPYKTKELFRIEVLHRFKGIRNKKRYLLIPEGVLTARERKELKKRKIKEINIRQQLRGNNVSLVYRDVVKALKQVLKCK